MAYQTACGRMNPPTQGGALALGRLCRLGLNPLLLRLRHWRLARLERHYRICAEIEEQQARQAHLNASWYQKQAALARRALQA